MMRVLGRYRDWPGIRPSQPSHSALPCRTATTDDLNHAKQAHDCVERVLTLGLLTKSLVDQGASSDVSAMPLSVLQAPTPAAAFTLSLDAWDFGRDRVLHLRDHSTRAGYVSTKLNFSQSLSQDFKRYQVEWPEFGSKISGRRCSLPAIQRFQLFQPDCRLIPFFGQAARSVSVTRSHFLLS